MLARCPCAAALRGTNHTRGHHTRFRVARAQDAPPRGRDLTGVGANLLLLSACVIGLREKNATTFGRQKRRFQKQVSRFARSFASSANQDARRVWREERGVTCQHMTKTFKKGGPTPPGQLSLSLRQPTAPTRAATSPRKEKRNIPRTSSDAFAMQVRVRRATPRPRS